MCGGDGSLVHILRYWGGPVLRPPPSLSPPPTSFSPPPPLSCLRSAPRPAAYHTPSLSPPPSPSSCLPSAPRQSASWPITPPVSGCSQPTARRCILRAISYRGRAAAASPSCMWQAARELSQGAEPGQAAAVGARCSSSAERAKLKPSSSSSPSLCSHRVGGSVRHHY